MLSIFGSVDRSRQPVSPGNIINLKPLFFVGIARADTDNSISSLEDEAGISAYTQTAGPIDLTIVRDVFRTIEYETESYIIGSVGIPDYPESHDVHVYVHADGWVVAYYLADDPTSKIMDLRRYGDIEIITTKLENSIYEVLVGVGAVPFDASYYDFRYPDATNLMLIVEHSSGNDTFEVQLPSDLTFYERSWAHAFLGQDRGWGAEGYYNLNGNTISHLGNASGWAYAQGTFTPTQLPPGAFNVIEDIASDGQSYAGLALVYREEP